jgi:hypothetical protein
MPGLAQTWQRLYDIGVKQKPKTQSDSSAYEYGNQLRITLDYFIIIAIILQT